MPELTVSLPLWIASQVLGFISVVVICFAYQIKTKSKIILIWGIGNALLGISLALLTNWIASALVAVAVVRSGAFYFVEHRREKSKNINPKFTFALMLLFMSATIFVVAFIWTWWFDWVLLGASLLISFANWAKGGHLFRIACAAYDSLIIVNYIMFFNVIGIVQSVLLVGAVAVYYIKHFIQNRKSDVLEN